jgi:phosphoglycerate-specific signal transduction histidine kinase
MNLFAAFVLGGPLLLVVLAVALYAWRRGK